MGTWPSKKDGFKASFMTRTSDTVRTHLQRCRALGEGLLKLCAHQSPYTGRAHRLFPLTAGRQRASEIRTHGNSARLNYILSLCSRATLLYIVTFLNLVPYIRRHSL